MKWKKNLIHGGILAAVFILAVVIISYVTNKDNSNTVAMGAATFPQVTFSYNGYAVNSLPVYADEMEIPSVRDTITLVTNGKLEMNLKPYENVVGSLTYRVYTLDGEEKLLENKVKDPQETVSLSFDGENILSEERVLEIILSLEDEKKVYLYTRIVDDTDLNAPQCLDYIRNFHENALKKADGSGIGKAIEANEEGDNSTFHHVTIHSNYDHVTWGALEPEVEGGERWSIKEINSTCVSVELRYRVRCRGEENETDLYNVKEFFRVRYRPEGDNYYLLDYDRTMDQVFDASHTILSEKGVLLGIADSNVPYMANKDGTIVSFVQANELWSFNKNTDEISLVFSFSDAENTDVRNLNGQHEIRLLDMDNDGNIVFVVYGYMNRGDHEGEVGAAFYYYHAQQNSVEEKTFISSNKSYERAVQELGELAYYSVERNMLYVLADGTLYEIDVDKEKKTALAEGLSENQYVISADGHIVAYQVSEDIIVKNFVSGKERTIEGKKEESIRPLGFINNDFVYGVARAADVGQTVSGQEVIPMYKIEIEDSKGKSVKTYEQEGIYILNADFENNMITLERAVKKETTYTGTSEDYITNNEKQAESNIYAETYVTELKETQVQLVYEDGIEDKEPKLLKPKQVMHEKAPEVVFENPDKEKRYYVYGLGELQGIFSSAGKAVQTADAYNGVVVSARQNYIWERGNRDLRYSISEKDTEIENIRTQLNGGTSPMDIMDEISRDKGLDLTGCSAEQLLYIVNQNTPVIAMLNTNTAVIIVGYTDGTVTYIDSAAGERHKASYEEMDNMTQGSGHTYIGYAK